MSGGSSIVEFWRDETRETTESGRSDDVLLLKQAVLDIEESEPLSPGREGLHPALMAFGVAMALAWIGFSYWALRTGGTLASGPAAWPGAAATILVPPMLIALLLAFVARGRGANARRYLDAARALRTETDLLEIRLQRIGDQLEGARQSMQDQAALLDNYGAAASSNMEAAAELIAACAAKTADRAGDADRAGQALAVRLESLIAAMPELEERASSMALRLEDNGHSLAARIDTLEARTQSLAELADDTRSRTLSATKSLSAQLSQVQEAARGTVESLNGIADVVSGRIGSTLNETRGEMEKGWQHLQARADALRALIDAAQTGIAGTSEATLATAAAAMESIEGSLRLRLERTAADAQEALAITDIELTRQAQELDALIGRSRDSLDAVGTETIANLAGDMNDVEGRLHQIGQMIEGQRTLVSELNGTLNESVDIAERRFAMLEETAMARSERLTDALAGLTAEAQRIDGALAAGGLTAEKMVGCAEGLMTALDASVRELDETYPAALDRFDVRIGTSRALVDSATPEMEKLEAISEALVGRTQEAEELLRNQGRRLTQWLESTQSGLEGNRAMVEELRAALNDAQQDATRLTEGAGPLLVTALLRVKDTADQAAERARQALGRAIPDAARALGDASDAAIRQALGDRVEAQIARIAQVAEEAVKAAHLASDRLTRQLLTIAETSASVEQRIEQADRMAEERDRDQFSHRSALLIESLNSTAIDVAKILSNDVTDSAWSAYLKGDRGVFTRRAVRLLDAGESREIALHYDEDPEFRDHVNRYIHDFEAMLRIILAARDGNMLGIAILSSDMGKLYVALAQAIERLRK
ncbi:MAG: hypothetical protein ABW039_11480 [Sphingobium sp.]